MTTIIGKPVDPVSVRGKDGLNPVSPSNPLPVDISGIFAAAQNSVETATQIPTTLTANQDFVGSTWIDIREKGNFIALIAGTKPFTTVELQWSDDGINPNGSVSALTNKPTVSGPLTYNVYLSILTTFVSGKYLRVHIVNGSTAQNPYPEFIGLALTGKFPYLPLIGLTDTLSLISSAILTRSVLAGTRPDGSFGNVNVSTENSLVVVEEGGVISPSGSRYSEGVLDYVKHDFGKNSVTSEIAKLIDLGSVGGTIIPDTVNGGAIFSTGATPGNTVIKRSQYTIRYSENTGHGIIVDQTIVLEPDSAPITGNAKIEWMFGDGNDGAGYGYDATGYYTWLKKNGSYVFKTYQANWNGDKVMGQNGTQFTRAGVAEAIRIDRDNLYRLTSEFLYAAEQNFYVKMPRGLHVKTHTNEYPNSSSTLSVSTANLPLFIEIHNDTVAGGDIRVRCGSWHGGMFTSKSLITGVKPDGTFGDVQLQGNDPGNTTNITLNAGGIFRGTWYKWQNFYVAAVIDMIADVAGTLYIDFSESDTPVNGDDSSVDDAAVLTYTPSTTLLKRTIPVQCKWIRLRYINGVAAQAKFFLDIAYLTAASGLVLAELSELPRLKTIAGYVRNVQAIPNVSGTGYVEVPVSSDGNPMVHVKAVDTPVFIQPPVSGPQTRQFVLTQSPIQIDLPDVTGGTGYRFVEVRNAGSFHAFVKEDNTITELNSNPLFLGGNAIYALTPGDHLWGLCENTGAASLTNNFYGTTGTAGALTSNDVRASQTTAGQVIFSDGFSFTLSPGYTTISRLRLGIEGRKQPGQTETVQFLESAVGAAATVGTVVSSSMVARTGAFYLAAISREVVNPTDANVNSVSGKGLIWTQVTTINSDDGKRRIDVWSASGDSVTDVVTAAFSTNPTSSRIAVHAYGNVNSIQAFGSTANTANSITGPALAGTVKGYSYLAAAINSATSTPGTGYTEITEQSGTTGTSDNLMTENKLLGVTGTETATASLSSTKHWAAIGVTLLPVTAFDPITTLSYNYNTVPGATSAPITLSSTVDGNQYVDITADFATINPSDISLIRVVSTASFVGSANIETDALFLEITQTSNATTRVAVVQVGGLV